MVPGVATLDRSPDQSPGVRPISPSTGTEGNQEGWPSWVEYRSGGTGGPHPGVNLTGTDKLWLTVYLTNK